MKKSIIVSATLFSALAFGSVTDQKDVVVIAKKGLDQGEFSNLIHKSIRSVKSQNGGLTTHLLQFYGEYQKNPVVIDMNCEVNLSGEIDYCTVFEVSPR